MPRKNVFSQGRLFVRHVLPAAVKPLHSLWHEVIGFIFIVFAGIIGLWGYRAIHKFSGDPAELMKLLMCGFFVLLLGGYGISSFRRARKISRS